MALNSVGNVLCFHNAIFEISQPINTPIFDYGKLMSFGSIEFGSAQIESIGQNSQSVISEQVLALAIDKINSAPY